MKKFRKWLAVFTLALACVLTFGAAFTASAASGDFTVTYKVPFFADIERSVGQYSAAEPLDITAVRGEMYGMPGHAFVPDGLEVVWYTDAAYTDEYGFDVAVTEDLTLYGKIVETSQNFRSNGFGWDVQSGRVYAGDIVNDNYITSNEYTSPTFTDESTGAATFSYDGIHYSVYGRGLDVTKPFTVELDFNSVVPVGSTAWFLVSLFPALTLAQAGVQGPWANAGAGSVVMFNLGDGGAPQTIAEGMTIVDYPSTTSIEYADGGAPFRAMFEGGNTSISLTAEIGESGTTFTSADGTLLATSPATRADFPSGYAYISLASNGSPSQYIGFDVQVRQQAGQFTVTGEHVTLGELSVNEMAVTLPITVEEGYRLTSVTVGGKPATFVELFTQKGTYAIDVSEWGADAQIAVVATLPAEEGEDGRGCGSLLAAGTGAAGIGAAALAAAVLVLVRKSKPKRSIR